MGAVSKLLQRGALFVARERDLTKKLVPPSMVEGDHSKFPKAGEIVLVMGKPVVRTGRVIPLNPVEATEIALDQLKQYYAQRVYEDICFLEYKSERPKVKIELPIKTVKAHEPTSLTAYRRPGMRMQRKHKTYPTWSEQ